MKMKKAFAAILAGTMCAGMLVGCGASQATQSNSETDRAVKVSDYDGEITLVIATKDEFLGTLDNAVKAAAEINNVELHSVDCGADQDKQNDAVRAAAENGVDALIVNLADDNRAQDVIDAAGDLPIVFVNRCPKDTSLLNDTHVYVGSDESTSGVMQGELLADALKKDGQTEAHYFMLKGTEGLLHTTARSEDVIATLQKSGITAEEAIPAVDCDFSRSVAMEKVNALLANGADFSKVDTIISNNDDMALGAIEALKQAGVDTSKMKIVGIDGTQIGLQAILDGDMTATVFQSASGQAAASLQAAINLASKEKVNTGISYKLEDHTIWVPFEKVTEDNVGDYY